MDQPKRGSGCGPWCCLCLVLCFVCLPVFSVQSDMYICIYIMCICALCVCAATGDARLVFLQVGPGCAELQHCHLSWAAGFSPSNRYQHPDWLRSREGLTESEFLSCMSSAFLTSLFGIWTVADKSEFLINFTILPFSILLSGHLPCSCPLVKFSEKLDVLSFNSVTSNHIRKGHPELNSNTIHLW